MYMKISIVLSVVAVVMFIDLNYIQLIFSENAFGNYMVGDKGMNEVFSNLFVLVLPLPLLSAFFYYDKKVIKTPLQLHIDTRVITITNKNGTGVNEFDFDGIEDLIFNTSQLLTLFQKLINSALDKSYFNLKPCIVVTSKVPLTSKQKSLICSTMLDAGALKVSF
ncbi:hypothetical protein [Moritella sp.]|uniref:hypothetical protein n=1 Tax=Moritella sp. TaxID=78556 RepID=UPI0025EF9A13|nr:hypothetical protein [Moritella sp.]